jgi:hypothetical protein
MAVSIQTSCEYLDCRTARQCRETSFPWMMPSSCQEVMAATTRGTVPRSTAVYVPESQLEPLLPGGWGVSFALQGIWPIGAISRIWRCRWAAANRLRMEIWPCSQATVSGYWMPVAHGSSSRATTDLDTPVPVTYRFAAPSNSRSDPPRPNNRCGSGACRCHVNRLEAIQRNAEHSPPSRCMTVCRTTSRETYGRSWPTA